MKKLLLVPFILLISNMCYGQKNNDTTLILIDTINIHGKVIDEDGESIANALIVTRARFPNAITYTVRTDKGGKFELSGIHPQTNFWIYSPKGNFYFSNNGSRYFLIKIPSPEPNLLDYKRSQTSITATRIKDRIKVSPKPIVGQTISAFMGHIEYPSTYRGGIAKFFNYIKENTIYPAEAIEKGIEGEVIVEFIVSENGSVTSPVLIRDIGYGCGEQVIEVLKKSKKWNAAFQDGRPRPTLQRIEIPFKLVD